jgi:NAD(P)-dependent dehydrogenase (short-subunit alcohol dehydrogenase family)
MMNDFQDKVAVVTGAASGIGRGLAERCAREGMKVVLADVDEPALQATAQEIQKGGGQVLAVRTDVSRFDQVEALADKTIEAFGAVHLLFNNAGVGAGALTWQTTIKDWHWVLGVNLWGVIHGIRSFVPIMVDQGTEGHIVNTSSLAGLVSGPGQAAYKVSKHGVVSLSETLYHELSLTGSRIGVSVLCPGFVKTAIMDAERNRPADLRNRPEEDVRSPEHEMWFQFFKAKVEQGMPPSEVADLVFKAIREGRFYVLTDLDFKSMIERRLEDVSLERNPTFVPEFNL